MRIFQVYILYFISGLFFIHCGNSLFKQNSVKCYTCNRRHSLRIQLLLDLHVFFVSKVYLMVRAYLSGADQKNVSLILPSNWTQSGDTVSNLVLNQWLDFFIKLNFRKILNNRKSSFIIQTYIYKKKKKIVVIARIISDIR